MNTLNREFRECDTAVTPIVAAYMRKDPGKPSNDPPTPEKRPPTDPQSPGDFPNEEPVQMPGQDRPGTTRPDQEPNDPDDKRTPNPTGPEPIPDDFPGEEPGIAPGEPGDERELNFRIGGLTIERLMHRGDKRGCSHSIDGMHRSSQSLSPKKTRGTRSSTRRRNTTSSTKTTVDPHSMVKDNNPQGNEHSSRRNWYDRNDK